MFFVPIPHLGLLNFVLGRSLFVNFLRILMILNKKNKQISDL